MVGWSSSRETPRGWNGQDFICNLCTCGSQQRYYHLAQLFCLIWALQVSMKLPFPTSLVWDWDRLHDTLWQMNTAIQGILYSISRVPLPGTSSSYLHLEFSFRRMFLLCTSSMSVIITLDGCVLSPKLSMSHVPCLIKNEPHGSLYEAVSYKGMAWLTRGTVLVWITNVSSATWF